MLTIELSNNITKLEQQRDALHWQLQQDTNQKDIQIHQWSLEEVEKKIAELTVK